MRLTFILLLLLHGAIHLMGSAKAFQWAPLAALREDITPLAGALWLLCALLLCTSALLLGTSQRYWWVPAAAGVMLSQALIASQWADARVGTLANLVIAVPVLLAIADLRSASLSSRFHADTRALLAATSPATASPVTDSELERLPPLVRAYLRRARVIGQPHVTSLRATFQARFRSGPAAPWMDATVTQYESFKPYGRLFFMRTSRGGLPLHAFHRYVDSAATFTVRAAGLVTVIDAAGPIMTQSETVTLLNDICILAPSALVDAPITWQTIDDTSVRAEFTNAGHTIAAVLTFDALGDLVNFRSDDRHQYDGKVDKLLPWLTPVSGYRAFGNVRLAAVGEARWLEAAGEWTYGRFVLQDIAYNVKR
jgi:hypothetical protein